MNIIEHNAPVTMVRGNLKGIPGYSLPAGYSLRSYQPGDEQLWVEIQHLADHYNTITPDLFRREFGTDGSTLAARQFYLLDAGQRAIGTATAWYDDSFRGLVYGRVHWVAIVPEQQGRGLAKPLMTAVCRRLRGLGHTRAYLSTSTARIPAIRLYLQFGFLPWIESPEDGRLWRQLERELENKSGRAGPP